jgi:Family of unknown function (DUF6225)
VAEVTEDEELFDHQVTAWTVGQLRAALEGVPDDTPVIVNPAEEPGGELNAVEQVVISADRWASPALWKDTGFTLAEQMRAAITEGRVRPDRFEISLEFPSGEYYRRTR